MSVRAYPLRLSRKVFVCFLLPACALPWLAACSKGTPAAGSSPKKEMAAFPVTAGTVVRKTIPLELRAVGSVEASATVEIKSQVAGEIREIHFTEGQDVNKGDLLFSIDPRSFENALHEAEAALAGSEARLANAHQTLTVAERTLATDRERGQAALEATQAHADEVAAEVRRIETLLAKGLVSQSEYDQQRTAGVSVAADLRQAQVKLKELETAEKALELQRQAIRVAEAQVRSDQVGLENAHLQLAWCSIYAPMAGRTGILMTHPGNLVIITADTPMVIINQIRPVKVAFSVPEKFQGEIRRLMDSPGNLKVAALITGEEDRPEEGLLKFVDNAVDNTSGTILLKGLFANTAKRLWPGQFVNIVLTLSQQEGAIIAPAAAIQTGQAGQYAFVIKDDLTVESRPVTVVRLIDQEALIDKGLQAGDRVVTDGQLRLTPGVKVEIKK